MLLPEAYTQGERFQLEKRRIFAMAWLPFCAAGQLGVPGAFVHHSLGGWPLFAIRGADGTARAFRNLCRHQGMPVVEKPAGQCDLLRCRYHGWTYDLTGALVATPPLVAPEDPAAAMHHLDALALVEADGMIQLRGRGADDAPPAALPPLGDRAFVEAIATDLDTNWKAAIEALLTDTTWRFIWPIAFATERDGVAVLRQIVPRSFSRTRVIDLLFAAPGTDIGALREAGRTARSAAEAVQAARAGGEAAPDSDFQVRLAAACGD